MNFEEIMAPLGADTFLRDYLGQRPVHIQGTPDKFHDVMNWDVLNRLLGATSIWTHQTLALVMDKEPIPPASYTASAPGRNGGTELRPDPVRVQQHIARGATLVLNFIDHLTPELQAFADAIEEALGGTVQANLYLSSKRKQGFRAHFDFHDVFAVHVMGEKTWTVFEGRADHPIKHPQFERWPQERHEELKGALWREVLLKPGDLLYLPRGQYHYALADEGPCAHIAVGVTYPIGMDAVSYAFERLVGESLGRRNLPRDRAQLQARLAEIGQLLARRLAEPQAVEDVATFMAKFRWPRASYDLPGVIERAEEAYQVKRAGIRLVAQGGRYGLLKEGTRQAVEIPTPIQPQVAWVLERDRFAKRELVAAFPAEDGVKIDRLLGELGRMALIEPA